MSRKEIPLNYRFILTLIIAATCTLNVQAASAERWFEVELLVFKRNVDIQNIGEQLEQQNVFLKQRERLEVFKAKQTTDCLQDQPCLHEQNPIVITNNEMVKGGHRLQLLDDSHLQLTKQFNQLKKHQLFTPLMHTVWRMPVQSKKNALPIHLFAGKNYALDINQTAIINNLVEKTENSDIETINTDLNVKTTENLDVLAVLQKPNVIQDLYEIDGNFTIYLEHYLFIDSQLIIRTETEKEITANTSEMERSGINDNDLNDDVEIEIVNQEEISKTKLDTESVITETLFDQNRRLRSEEIHYFDHPLFGIIVQIRKIP